MCVCFTRLKVIRKHGATVASVRLHHFCHVYYLFIFFLTSLGYSIFFPYCDQLILWVFRFLWWHQRSALRKITATTTFDVVKHPKMSLFFFSLFILHLDDQKHENHAQTSYTHTPCLYIPHIATPPAPLIQCKIFTQQQQTAANVISFNKM